MSTPWSAGPCSNTPSIPETCTGCLACVRECPVGAITGIKKMAQELDQELCIKCGLCYETCQFDAVKVSKLSSSWQLINTAFTVDG